MVMGSFLFNLCFFFSMRSRQLAMEVDASNTHKRSRDRGEVGLHPEI